VNITEIHRYLSGEATQEEAEQFERWLEQSEENRETFKRFQQIYSVEIEYKYQFNKEAALRKFRQVMDAGSASSAGKAKIYNHTHLHRRKRGTWLKVAAMIIAVTGISLYLVSDFSFDESETVNEVVAGVTISTEPGEQKSFRLSDGSRIRLNSASSMYIPSGFAKTGRSVELLGEAFFEVQQGHEYDFTVNTSTAQISVLGTSFSVRAWQDRDESIIAVQTGTVSLRSSDPQIIEQTVVTAGQYSQVRAGEAPGPALDANLDQYFGWTNQMFVFDETPLMDVLRQLELHFNVRITVSDSSSIYDPVTARYRNESLSEILRFTSITHGVEFDVESLNNNNQKQ
jgi:transmembrane sensor